MGLKCFRRIKKKKKKNTKWNISAKIEGYALQAENFLTKTWTNSFQNELQIIPQYTFKHIISFWLPFSFYSANVPSLKVGKDEQTKG